MSPLTTVRDATTRPRPRIPFEWWWFVVAVAAVVLTFAIAPHLRTGRFVGAVHVQNSSEFDVDVDTASSPSDGWMGVGTAINKHTLNAEQVYDVGGVWYFRFSTPEASAEVRTTRAQLEQDDWTVKVPADFVTHLRDINAPPSPVFNER
jgi:hypothetical protein